MSDAASTSKQTRRGPGRVVTVMSPKGGVGRTVVATNVAVVLTEWVDENRVVLVDADLQFGDVSLALKMDPDASFGDAASIPGDELDARTLGKVLSKHPSGLWVLPAPPDPLSAEDISVEAVLAILGRMRRMFAYVIVDTGAFLGEPMLSIIEGSDIVLVVVDPDIQSVKNTKLAVEALRMIKFPIDRLRLVMNRADLRAALDVDEVAGTLDLPIAARVPADSQVLLGVNRGEPVATALPRSRVARGLRDVARIVAQPEDIPQERKRR